MECKMARYWISIYLDKELDRETEMNLLEHIEKCNECNKFLEESLDISSHMEQLFNMEEFNDEKIKTDIMNTIKKEHTIHNENTNQNKSKKKSRFRKLALSAAVLIVLFMTVPINGKTAMAHVNGWTKSFIIRKPGFIIKVDDIENAYDHKPTPGFIYREPEVSKQEYYTINDIIENVYKIEKKPCILRTAATE